jgi:uncharacterized protein (TIGR00369 family)
MQDFFVLHPFAPVTISPPEGFRPIQVGGPFIAHNVQLHARLVNRPDGDQLQLGFRVEPHHTNPLGFLHGGMMATFVDMLGACVMPYQTQMERRFLPTVSLQMDFLSSPKVGDWVQAEAQILRETRNLLFTQGLVHAGEELVLRTSAVYKIGKAFDEWGTDPRDPFKLRSAVDGKT